MGDQIIFLPYIHAISKNLIALVSLLAKENSKAKELLAEDAHINEIIILEKDMDGLRGMLNLIK